MKQLFANLLHNRLAIGAVVILLAAAGYWYYAVSGNGRVTYESQPVDRGNIETSVASSGSVSPLQTVTVGSEVSGKIVDVLVDFNAPVHKGQKLAQLDNSTYLSRVQQAEADLVVQQATIESRAVDVGTADVNLNQAQRDDERTKMLFDKGLASANDREKTQNALNQSQNALKIAKANFNNAKSQLVKVKATLDQARIDLGRTTIISPVDGVVISRKIDPGQTVAAAMQAPELFQLAMDLSQIRIETKVDEADIGTIKEGARATFTVDAFPERSFQGRVAQVRINGTMQQNVVTYSVMVQAANPGQILLPGMTANVKILTSERANVLRVPSAALRFRPPTANSGAGAGPGPAGAGGPGAVAGLAAGGAGGQRAGGAGRGRMMVQMTPEVMTELGLSADQKARVSETMRSIFQRPAQAQSGTNPLGGGPNFRGFAGAGGVDFAQIRQRITNALSNILTPEQMQKYQAMSASNAPRNGTVWALGADGKPAQKVVRIGLASDSYTEVIQGLAEGDKVVVRARAEQKKS
jgi:HlyD family secretion protein